jgi:beta-glucosidase
VATLGLSTFVAVGCSKRVVQGPGTGGEGAAPATGSMPGVGDGDGDVTPGSGGGSGAGPSTVDPILPNDPSCQASPLVRANVLHKDGAGVNHPDAVEIMSTLTPADQLELISGGPNCPSYNCDFDGTGIAAKGVPDFKMRDGPRGVHTHNGDKATSFAVAMARAASFDLSLEYAVGDVQGKEMLALNYDLALAPTINTLRHPGWARAQETYGEDPVLLGEMGAAFTNGIQQHVPACPKHFAGNNTDENRHSMMADMDEQTLRENYTRAFQITVEKSDPACIMAAYNGVSIDGVGQRMTQQKHLLTDILRDDWGWGGFVVSDWWATDSNSGDLTLNAGTDYEMPDKVAFQSLPTGAAPGRIEEAAMRTLNARAVWGQLKDGYRSEAPVAGIVNEPAHKEVALRTGVDGAVLLHNDGILPIAPTVKSIIVMGPDAALPVTDTGTANTSHGMGDRGSSNTNPPYAVSYLDGIKARAGAGVEVTSSTNPQDAAGKDIVIIPVTMAHEDEGEAFGGGGDRDSLTLGANHPVHWGGTKPTALIKAVAAVNPNVVVLIAVGGAVVIEDWGSSAKAIVHSFYQGQEAGNAMATLLWGDKNFNAKLPFTVAINAADYPIFGNKVDAVKFDYLHGYRKFEAEGLTPRYWFGYGLSYTTFAYSDLQLLCDASSQGGAVNAKITVTNTGTVAGREIVQAYIGYPNTAVRRPKKELKAFAKTDEIAPGASVDVYFSIPARDLAYWAAGGWTIENVEHELIVAASANPAETNALKVPFTLAP